MNTAAALRLSAHSSLHGPPTNSMHVLILWYQGLSSCICSSKMVGYNNRSSYIICVVAITHDLRRARTSSQLCEHKDPKKRFSASLLYNSSPSLPHTFSPPAQRTEREGKGARTRRAWGAHHPRRKSRGACLSLPRRCLPTLPTS